VSIPYLNLGCGVRRHPDWINVDAHARVDGILEHDLRRPLPFPDNTFKVVYHSHTLEHFDAEQGRRLMRECHRVLAPGGVVRVVVPDLEQIARDYLTALEAAEASETARTRADHEWMLIEMTDPLARHHAGGEQDRYIARVPLENAPFVIERWGAEGRAYIEQLQRTDRTHESAGARAVRRLRRIRRYPTYIKLLALRMLLGTAYRTWALGEYRLSGEVHLYMYDRFNLRRLLEGCGFEGVVQQNGRASYVDRWARFNLDTEPDGSLYRPVSLFMEGVKPARS
jgi:SAM-dependent methyltransferase